MAEPASESLASHPAPHRNRVGLGALLFGLFAAPIFWSGHEMTNYGLTNHFCFPGAVPLTTAPGEAGWLWPLMLAFDVITLAVIAAAGWLAYRNWSLAREEAAGHHEALLDVGEGRTRFLGLCGMLFSLLFFGATVFDLIALFLEPLC